MHSDCERGNGLEPASEKSRDRDFLATIFGSVELHHDEVYRRLNLIIVK
jgi:hypothetical protein